MKKNFRFRTVIFEIKTYFEIQRIICEIHFAIAHNFYMIQRVHAIAFYEIIQYTIV